MVAKKTNFGSVLFVPDIQNVTLLNHIIIVTYDVVIYNHLNEFQGEFERRGQCELCQAIIFPLYPSQNKELSSNSNLLTKVSKMKPSTLLAAVVSAADFERRIDIDFNTGDFTEFKLESGKVYLPVF